MTEPHTKETVAEIESTAPTPPPEGEATPPPEGEATPPPAPEPEPWTPERVSEWNAYYDRYVMGAALLLALIVSCNYVADSSLFLHLKAGELINERTAPVTTDEFSYTENGHRWVDVPWLFQWSHAALYGAIYSAVPVDPADTTANQAKADRIAMGGLGLLDALVKLATAWVLLKIRHRGPGLWWSAICVALAVGIFYDPLYGVSPGGLASVHGVAAVSSTVLPATWGYLFLALELLMIFRGFAQGRRAWLWWLIPLFVLWANSDVSFLPGLLIFGAVVVGHWLDGGGVAWPEAEGSADSADVGGSKDAAAGGGEPPAGRPVPAATGFLVLGLSAAAALVNPWTFRVYPAAADPFLRLFQPSEHFQFVESLSFFGIRNQFRGEGAEYLWTWLMAFYLIMVAAGLGAFLLNSARFSWRRFLPFVVVSLLWGCLMRHSVEFALVLCAVVALNGQEWYLARFGTRGRLGNGWTLWSTGGRLATLALVFFMVGVDITGGVPWTTWRIQKPGIHFGLGYNPDHFPIEAAEFLAQQNDLRGNVLNTSMAQGDLLIWKASPKRLTFVDGRTSLFPQSLLEKWHLLRASLRDDDVATWKPWLDEHEISAVMIEPADSAKTYEKLKDSRNWIPFYDDGRVAMFGRSDAPKTDVAVFEANRLQPDRVFRVTRSVPAAEGPPTPTSWIDEVFQNRSLGRAQMRTQSAFRWLTSGASSGQALTEPARCLLAIQDARIALSRNPDDPVAFRILNDAYRLLTVQETALLAGIPLTAQNQTRISQITASPDRLLNRYRQRVTALSYAIQTSPKPRSPEARNDLFDLNMQLFEQFAAANAIDLARDRLRAALEVNPTEEYLQFRRISRAALQDQFNQLDQRVNQTEQNVEDRGLELQARPVDVATLARQQGLVGMAITKLADAETSGDSVSVVKPQLLDLYCLTGQPEKALELLAVGSIGDPNLGTEPGVATYRQGLVYFLLGNYMSTASLWEQRSIPALRMDRSSRALSAGRSFIHGEAMGANNMLQGISTSLAQQATWEFDLAMCQLEGGRPDEAADHFTKALTLEPDLPVRPIAAYYLERLGKPVPPKRERPGASKPAAVGPSAVKPATSPAPTPHGQGQPAKPSEVKPKAEAPEPAKLDGSTKPPGEPATAKKETEKKATPK
jgi:tetratricopeptide (TPR) repeat protein